MCVLCNWQQMLLMYHKEVLKYPACRFSRVTPSTYVDKAKQVDILISKNQALQIHACMHSYTTINIPYNWPAFLAASCLNIECMFSYELIRIRY